MGLFTFIKNLFVKAEQIETVVEKLVNEVEVIAPEAKKITTLQFKNLMQTSK